VAVATRRRRRPAADGNGSETAAQPANGQEPNAAETPDTEVVAEGSPEPEAADETPARRGTVGEEIYEQVERLVAAEKIGRTEAFGRISEQTGRKPGTVAANYYRVARKRGEGRRPRRAQEPRGARRRTRAGGGSTTAALGQLREALEALGAAVKSQEEELRQLRKDRGQLEELRRLMGGGGRRRRS
jgi:hypothetical protein